MLKKTFTSKPSDVAVIMVHHRADREGLTESYIGGMVETDSRVEGLEGHRAVEDFYEYTGELIDSTAGAFLSGGQLQYAISRAKATCRRLGFANIQVKDLRK